MDLVKRGKNPKSGVVSSIASAVSSAVTNTTITTSPDLVALGIVAATTVAIAAMYFSKR